MSEIFRLNHDSFSEAKHVRVPWIMRLVGVTKRRVCSECRGEFEEPQEAWPLTAQLERKTGVYWPDALGSGATLGVTAVVSSRFVDAWQRAGLGQLPLGGVAIVPPAHRRLSSKRKPDYFWLDGRKLRVGKLDFHASGFVDARACNSCGNFQNDLKRSLDAGALDEKWAFREIPDRSCNLFVTDMSHLLLFCRSPVRDMIESEGLTNFRFVSAHSSD